MSATQVQVGSLLRDWRQRRRLSQLELALEADVSARHLSFVETGRSRPSASMVLLLAEQLEVPLRERNRMLLAAGHAPAFQSHDLDEPPMAPVRAAIDLILAGHDPYPALVVDRAWEMIAANRAVSLLTAAVASSAGKNASIASSEAVTSTAVPNVATVEMKASSPSGVCSRSGTAIAWPGSWPAAGGAG